MKLLLATRNAGKLKELRTRVRGLEVLSLDDVAPMPDVDETEETLEGNARLKAVAGARGTGLWTVADDSGLFVDALGGAPGVRSARYAPGSDMNRILALLEAMDRLPDDERGASFRCVLALASPEGAVRPVEGACRGRILRAPRGSGGFGYDPVFLLPELKRTMAELSLKEKGRVSHRARALDALEPLLRELSSGAPRHG
jgi:XTP/dITP diphosphohydrolase